MHSNKCPYALMINFTNNYSFSFSLFPSITLFPITPIVFLIYIGLETSDTALVIISAVKNTIQSITVLLQDYN